MRDPLSDRSWLKPLALASLVLAHRKNAQHYWAEMFHCCYGTRMLLSDECFAVMENIKRQRRQALALVN